MRRWRRSIVPALVATVLAGCGEEPRDGDENRLVLELGGDGVSIERLLRAAGEPRAAIPLRSDGTPHANFWEGRTLRHRTVTLAPGQTLSELCMEHLGSASRWREVMELNGWDEEQVRRLPAGAEVRLPVD